MRLLERFLRAELQPLAAPLVIFTVAAGRLAFEYGLFPAQVSTKMLCGDLVHTAAFYLAAFFLFSLVLRVSLNLEEEKAKKAACAGLLAGLLPPLIDIFAGLQHTRPYAYFADISLTLFSPRQSVAESFTLWAAIAGCGALGLLLRKGILRALLACISAYTVIQLCSGLSVAFQKFFFRTGPKLALGWLGLSALAWAALRFGKVSGSLRRLPHCLPHTLLATCGAAWVQRDIGEILQRTGLVLFILFLVLVQNDHYDAGEEERGHAPQSQDAAFGYLFQALLIFWLGAEAPKLALLMSILVLSSVLYQHPAFRLKKTFCLSYKLEGLAGLMCFLTGAAGTGALPYGAGLLVPSLLVFGGATLLSIPKDYKDTESDGRAGIPTYYVVLARRGVEPRRAHRWLSLVFFVCLLVPPAALLWMGAPLFCAGILAAAAFVCTAGLVFTKSPASAVRFWLYALSGYLSILAACLRGGLSA